MKNVSIISEILRSANSLKKNGDIGRINDQFTMGTIGSFIFEEEYINNISDLNIPTLAIFSTSTFSNSFRSKILRSIVQINFLYYIFFYFERYDTHSIISSNSASIFWYYCKMVRSSAEKYLRMLQFKRFWRTYLTYRKDSKGETL